MAKRRAGNQTLASAIDSVVGRMDKGGSGYRKALVVTAWENVAGPQIASHAHGAFMKDDELLVFMDSPVWAAEMQGMSESFRVAINEEIGREAVRSLRFTVSRRPAREAFVDPISTEPDLEENAHELPEIPQAEYERFREESLEVADPKLREALLAARTAATRREKGREESKTPQEPREDL